MAQDLEEGLIDRLRSLPIPRAAVLCARAAADTAIFMWIAGVTTLVAFAVGFRLHGTALEGLEAFGLAVLFGFAFEWLFVTIALFAGDPQAAQGMGMIAFPFVFVSSAYVPIGSMPTWLQAFAKHQPMTYMVDAVRSLTLGPRAHELLGHTSSYYVGRSLAWTAAIIVVTFPRCRQIPSGVTRGEAAWGGTSRFAGRCRDPGRRVYAFPAAGASIYLALLLRAVAPAGRTLAARSSGERRAGAIARAESTSPGKREKKPNRRARRGPVLLPRDPRVTGAANGSSQPPESRRGAQSALGGTLRRDVAGLAADGTVLGATCRLAGSRPGGDGCRGARSSSSVLSVRRSCSRRTTSPKQSGLLTGSRCSCTGRSFARGRPRTSEAATRWKPRSASAFPWTRHRASSRPAAPAHRP
jgi:ABC transporter DrrB family efflux protein